MLSRLPKIPSRISCAAFLIQRFIVIATLRGLNATGATVGAGAGGDEVLGGYEPLCNLSKARLCDADATGVGVMNEYGGGTDLIMISSRNATNIVSITKSKEGQKANRGVFEGVNAACNVPNFSQRGWQRFRY